MQVLPRLLRNFLASGDVEWFIALFPAPPSAVIAGADQDGNAELAVLYQQVISLTSYNRLTVLYLVCACF
jgi:hypothetical protein